MRLSLQPPHAERGDVQHQWDKSGDEHSPPADQPECFAVVKREKPCQEPFTAGRLPPILDAKDLTAVLIQPDLTFATGWPNLSRLMHSKVIDPMIPLRQSKVPQLPIREYLSRKRDCLLNG